MFFALTEFGGISNSFFFAGVIKIGEPVFAPRETSKFLSSASITMKGKPQQDFVNSIKPFKVFLQDKTKERTQKEKDSERLEDVEDRLVDESRKMKRRELEYRFKLEKKLREFDQREREYEEKLERKITEIERKLCDLERKLRVQCRLAEESEGGPADPQPPTTFEEPPKVETRWKSSLFEENETQEEKEKDDGAEA